MSNILTMTPEQMAALLGINLTGKASDSFALVMAPITLPASGNAAGTVQVSTDFGFLITHQMAYATAAGTYVPTVQVPAVANLTVSQSSRSFTQRVAPIGSVFGTGERPYYLGMPGVLVPGSTLTAELQNLSAVEHVVRLVFAGFRIYQFSAGGMR